VEEDPAVSGALHGGVHWDGPESRPVIDLQTKSMQQSSFEPQGAFATPQGLA
jgi:hypothetical protein